MFLLTACFKPSQVDLPPDDPSTGGGPPKRVLGTIAFYDDPVEIILPAAVARGETLIVAVTTYGGGCLKQGDTEVRVTGLEAQITPYDLATSVPEYPCTADLAFYTHTAELRFTETGEARIQVTGLQKNDQNVQSVVTHVTRTLTVR